MSQYCNPLSVSLFSTLCLLVCLSVTLSVALSVLCDWWACWLPQWHHNDDGYNSIKGNDRSLCCVSSINRTTHSFLLLHSATTMSRPAGGSVNDVTHFLSTGAGPESSTSVFSASRQADWAAKRLVWVPSEKHGFEVRLIQWKSGWAVCIFKSIDDISESIMDIMWTSSDFNAINTPAAQCRFESNTSVQLNTQVQRYNSLFDEA